MYKVLKAFKDLKDDNYRYEVGDTYPRTGAKPSAKRIAELSSDTNKLGTPLIEEIKEEPKEEVKEEKKAEKKTTKKKGK